MNNSTYSFGCTALMGTNKAGVLKPNADGYYPVVLGAFNAFNSAEQYYPVEPAMELFAPDSALRRRLANGALRGEYGHPRRMPGMTNEDFLYRIADILESNVSHHIRNVTMIPNGMRDEQGRPIVGVVGEVKPAGPRGADLRASFENPSENVCFSIRSITNDRMVNGRYTKFLRAIYTWDYVNEPGMNIAKKWHSPALEQFQEVLMDEAAIRSVARRLSRKDNTGMESTHAQAVLRQIMLDIGFESDSGAGSRVRTKVPPSGNW